MANKRNHFALGLWVIAVLTLFVACLVFIGGQQWGQTYRTYTVRYPVTFALPDEIKPGAQIFCGATVVGRVDDLALVAEEGRTDESQPAQALWAHLQVRIHEALRLHSDCRILARGPLLGGGGKLIIRDPGQAGDPLPDGAVIVGAPSGSMEETLDLLHAELNPGNPAGLLATIKEQLDPADVESILGKIHRSLDDLNAMTVSLARQLQPADREALLAKLHVILDHVNQTTSRLREEVQAQGDAALLGKVHLALNSLNHSLTDVSELVAENRPAIRNTLAATQRTVETIEHDVVQPIATELNAANTRSLLNQVHQSFDQINVALADIQIIGDTAKATVLRNEERFNRLMLNISETSAHLKGASKDLRRNPWRLFYRPSLEETKQLNIFDAAREFAEAAARLDDSATQLTALLQAREGHLPTDDPDLTAICDRLKQTFDDYARAEEALWRQLDVQ